MNSLFEVLKREDLTTLKLRYNFRDNQFTFLAAKEWEADANFSTYNKTFTINGIQTDHVIYLNTLQVEAIFEKHGAIDYLKKVQDLVRQGKHFGIDFLYHDKMNIRFVCGLHSNVRGLNNKSHATYAGATRRHGLDKEEIAVIIDALNLSRAMTFKNIAVDIPFGGCKTTIQMESLDITNMEMMGFLAYACDSTRCLTGPDMNFPKTMVKIMNERFTMQYCGGPGSALGDTAIPTAYGAYLALKQAVKFRTGSACLDGMSVAIQGLGSVGYSMASYLASEKTKLFITDLSEDRVVQFINEHPEHEVVAVGLDEILNVDADIFAPCAMGGILGDEEIARLKFKYIFGAANNQLRATSQAEEIRLAKLLDERGILFQTEWWHNAAGVLAAAEEYTHGFNQTVDDLMKKVESILPVQTWKNLTKAKALGITPTECAYQSSQSLIYGN